MRLILDLGHGGYGEVNDWEEVDERRWERDVSHDMGNGCEMKSLR